jgi:CheY-like chemotaxis protein
MSEKRATILVVDSDPSLRQSVRVALRTEGFRVLEAPDYRAAQNVWHQHRLADVEPDLKVLFVSGEAGAMASQYQDSPWKELQTLTRPFEAADLLRRIKSI